MAKSKSESGRYKYKSRPQMIDGRNFASKKEARRYLELRAMQERGEIGQLKCQVPFELLPRQTDENGKFLYHPCKYIADFTYYTKDGEYIVEDVKGVKTEVYKIKAKMMYYFHEVKIRET